MRSSCKGGSLTVKADGDGLKSDSEDEGLGNIYLENAWLSVEAGTTAFRPTAICM